jgi:hypothetical protein
VKGGWILHSVLFLISGEIIEKNGRFSLFEGIFKLPSSGVSGVRTDDEMAVLSTIMTCEKAKGPELFGFSVEKEGNPQEPFDNRGSYLHSDWVPT